MKRSCAAVLLLAALLTTTACGEGADTREREARGAIARTKRLPRSFVYTERTAASDITVQGILEDDYRYKAQLSSGRRPVVEEVVVDDALAVRFLEPGQVPTFLASTPQGISSAIAPPAAPSDRNVLEALGARRWVLDRVGAPELVVTRKGAERRPGDDALLDGLTILAYVERAMSEAQGVVRFNKESVQYQPGEDVFPVPDEESGVVRYDTIAPELPKPSRSGGAAGQGAPQTSHFRRLSVYVKDDRVVEVREVIAPLQRHLDHLAEFYDIKASTDDVARAGAEAIASLNQLRQGAGDQPIRPRTMSLELLDFESADRIALPSGAIAGGLGLLRGRGRASR